MPTPSHRSSGSRSSKPTGAVPLYVSESLWARATGDSPSTTSKTATDEPADVRPVIARISSRSASITTSTDGQPDTDPNSESTSEIERPEHWVCRSRYLGQTCDLPLVKTTYGFGHVNQRRWAHAPVAKRIDPIASAPRQTDNDIGGGADR